MDFEVELSGGAPWGFRIQGGKEFHSPIKITFLKPGGKAAKSQGIRIGDHLTHINGVATEALTHTQAEQQIKRAGSSVTLALHRKEPPKSEPCMQPDKVEVSVDGDDDPPPITPRRRTCSVPARAETVADKGKDPDWYKSMFKDIHQSVELKATPMGGEEVVTRAPVRKKASVYEMEVQKTNEYNAERSRRPSRQSLTGRPAPSPAVLALSRSHEEGAPVKQYEDNVFMGSAEEGKRDGQKEEESVEEGSVEERSVEERSVEEGSVEEGSVEEKSDKKDNEKEAEENEGKEEEEKEEEEKEEEEKEKEEKEEEEKEKEEKEEEMNGEADKEEDKENMKPISVSSEEKEEEKTADGKEEEKKEENVPEPVFESTPTKKIEAAPESNPSPSKSVPDSELSEGEIVINTTNLTITDHSDVSESKSLDIDRSGGTELNEAKDLVLLSAITSPQKSEEIKSIQKERIPEFV